MMSGRLLAILVCLQLTPGQAKLVVLDEADLLLSRFEYRPKLVGIFVVLKNLVLQYM